MKLMSTLLAATLALTAAPLLAKVAIGQPAPAFSLTDSNGKTRTLEEFKGKTVVLEWTNAECPFVRKHYDSDNMQAQHESWVSGHEAAAVLPEVGVVAVAPGAGIAAAFRELGVGQIVSGGPSANPSTGELLDAARRAATNRVFILPNDPNVVMVAQQAQGEAPDLISVLPARTVGAGLAAALAFAPGAPPDEAEASMLEAIEISQEIAGRQLLWSYKEANRVGDHIWWISDTSKFESHYPDWKLEYDVPAILGEIAQAGSERWMKSEVRV